MLTFTDKTGNPIISLRNPVESDNCYIIVSTPKLIDTHYILKECSNIKNPDNSYFGDKILIGGSQMEGNTIKTIEVTKEKY